MYVKKREREDASERENVPLRKGGCYNPSSTSPICITIFSPKLTMAFLPQMGRGSETPPVAEGGLPSSRGTLNGGGFGVGFGFGLREETAAEGDVLLLDPRDPTALGGKGPAVDLERQPPRWPEEDEEEDLAGRRRNMDGDALVLNPDQGAVRRRVRAAPAFEKQLGWRERQAVEALEERGREWERREAWGWAEAAEGEAKGDDDSVERADRARR